MGTEDDPFWEEGVVKAAARQAGAEAELARRVPVVELPPGWVPMSADEAGDDRLRRWLDDPKVDKVPQFRIEEAKREHPAAAAAAKFRLDSREDRICSCVGCGPWQAMIGMPVPEYDVERLCSCSACSSEDAPGRKGWVCKCPVCSDWPKAATGGGSMTAPTAGAVAGLTGTPMSGLSLAAGLEERKAQQARLTEKVLKEGPSAIALLRHVIRKARRDDRFIKTGARAAIDLLRLSLPVGWEAEKDSGVSQEAFLKAFSGAMKEAGNVMKQRIEAAEKGLKIEMPVIDVAAFGKKVDR